MSVRNTIFDNLAVALAAIAPGTGYATTVVTVLKNVPHSEQVTVPAGQAVVALTDDGEDEEITHGASNRVLLEMRIVTHALMSATRFNLPPIALANNWLGDLREFIRTVNTTPSTLHSQCRYVVIAPFPGGNVTDQDAQAVVTLRIIYWIDETSP